MQEIVENCFLGVGLQEFGSLTDEVNPFDSKAMKEALGYVEQWRLVVWARGANEDHGVAPSTGSLLQRFQEAAAQWPEEARPPVPADVSQAKARMWARRWRNRWCGRFARIRVREDISAAELLEKVGLKFIRTCERKNELGFKLATPFRGPFSVLCFGVAYLNLNRAARKWGTADTSERGSPF